MSIATDARAYADAALEQGRAVLGQATTVVTTANKRIIADAPKPAFAAIGAADLLATTVTKRFEALPTDAVGGAAKAQQSGRALLNRTQSDAVARLTDLRGRVDAGLDSVTTLPIVARNTTEGYLSIAKDLLGKLTARGEAKAAELRDDVVGLRNDPRVSKIFGEVTDLGETAQSRVTPAVTKVRSQVQPLVRSAFDAVQSVDIVESAAARTLAARSTVTTRRQATKPAAVTVTEPAAAPAKKTPAKTAPKATATKATAPKATATKATAPKTTAPAKKTTSKATPAKSATAKTVPAKTSATKTTTAKSTAAKKATGPA